MTEELKLDRDRTQLRTLVERVLVPHTPFEIGRKRARQLIRYREAGATQPKGLAVLGESRTGKSRLLKAILSEWPASRNADGLTVPILAARVPSGPTIKGLAEVLLRKLGATDWHKGTEGEMTNRLETLFKGCGVLAVALDEFHHFMDRRSERVQHEVADWLKVLSEETKVCLIVLGLPRMTAVIRQNEQLQGRFLAPVSMPRFDWFDDEQRAAWLGILGAFTEALSPHFDIVELDTRDIGFRLWCVTGGLIGYLAQILTQATMDAIDECRRRIGLADLAAARETALFAEEENPKGMPKALGPEPLIVTEQLVKVVRSIGVEEEPQRVPKRKRSRSTSSSKGDEGVRFQGGLP